MGGTMKTFILILFATCLSACAEVLDSTTGKAETGHGVTLTFTGASIWTNAASAPVKLDSIVFDASGSYTVTVSLLRRYDVDYQTKASDVTTNELGWVVTNVYRQVTNVVASFKSNTMVAAVLTNDSWVARNALGESRLIPEGQYTRRGDLWYFTVSDTNVQWDVNFSE